MSHSPSILLLAPQLYGDPGGIQAYMRRLWEIVSAYGETRECQVCCLSLVDWREEIELQSHPVKHAGFSSCRRNKLTFVLRAIGHVRTYRDGLVVVGHIRQAPVAWVMKRLGLIRSYILVTYGIDVWTRVPWLQREAARCAECIVSISWYTAQEFCKHNGVALEQFRVIPPSLAEDEINPLGRAPKNDSGELSVLTVGRLSVHDRYKGIDLLIQAVGKARNDVAKIHLTVVGDGDDLSRLKELVSRLGLDGYVTFLRSVPDGELQQLYQKCDVFAMPSKKEGFGIVFLEAMRFGKPCIGSNHGGIPEVITHGVDGYLVNYGDIDRLAQYLIEFSQSPELRQNMGLNGYEKVKARYLFSRMRDDWLGLLDEFVSRR